MNKISLSINISSGNRRLRIMKATLLVVSLMTALTARGQETKRTNQVPQARQERSVDQLAESRNEFVRSTKEYKASLERLLAFYEADARKAEQRLAKLRELYGGELISRRDLDEGERALAEAQVKVSEAHGQLKKADEQIAETLVEAQVAEQMERAAARASATNPRPGGSLIRTTAYIRYDGTGGWLLSEASRVQRFYTERFGRPLPVSAFGQSSLHDRWGLDHHNAMDVGINPDSIEGQALTAYLRASGIPFMAFRYAIPGAATGPHIHIGRPSHRVIR